MMTNTSINQSINQSIYLPAHLVCIKSNQFTLISPTRPAKLETQLYPVALSRDMQVRKWSSFFILQAKCNFVHLIVAQALSCCRAVDLETGMIHVVSVGFCLRRNFSNLRCIRCVIFLLISAVIFN